jgi:hypothetical protein
VAIVQISRITQRKGLAIDLPDPLASAELGWAIDERKLYIGNGTLEEGAPVIGNTEVLTQFSDILSYATEYTYKGDAGGYTVQTGATTGSPVSQPLQYRLDSYAVITDFIEYPKAGDGTTDVTADINRALNQIFCQDINPSIRRSIFFPAGTYIITDTLLIPPYCKIYGEGSDSTIISFNVQPWTSTIAYEQGVLVTDGTDYYRSLASVPIGQLLPVPPASNSYWAPENLPGYMFRTTDSLQQTGVNIGTGGAERPGYVEMSGMKFVTNMPNSGALVEAAVNCSFDNIGIEGNGITTTLTTATLDTSCVEFATQGSYVVSNITWNSCQFTNMVWGVNTDTAAEGVTVSNCLFDVLYQGVYLGTLAPGVGYVGPTGFRIVQNKFDNVYAEGLSFVNISLNASAYNTFYDVGNHFNGVTAPISPVIDLDSTNNVSVGDMFARTTQYSTALHPCIKLNNKNSIALGMNVNNIQLYQSNVVNLTLANQLGLGTYQRTAGIQDAIANNSTANLAYVTGTYVSSFKMDYTISRGDFRRTGSLIAVKGQAATGTGFAYTDDYVENGVTGVTLTAAADGANVLVSYTSTNTTTGTINYSITNLG